MCIRDSLELVLLAVLQGEVQQPVRVEGVAAPGKVDTEVEAFLGRRDRHVVDHDLRLGARASVLAREPLGVRSLLSAARGRGHVELKTAPDRLYLVAVVEARQGRFEAPLTDIAPRADNVGPDFNFQAHDGTNNITDPSLPGARTPAHAISVWFPVTSENQVSPWVVTITAGPVSYTHLR